MSTSDKFRLSDNDFVSAHVTNGATAEMMFAGANAFLKDVNGLPEGSNEALLLRLLRAWDAMVRSAAEESENVVN